MLACAQAAKEGAHGGVFCQKHSRLGHDFPPEGELKLGNGVIRRCFVEIAAAEIVIVKALALVVDRRREQHALHGLAADLAGRDRVVREPLHGEWQCSRRR